MKLSAKPWGADEPPLVGCCGPSDNRRYTIVPLSRAHAFQEVIEGERTAVSWKSWKAWRQVERALPAFIECGLNSSGT